MTTAVYYVGGPDPDDRDELRHSLRSIEAHAPFIDEVYVVGDVPDWFTGVKVPLEPQPEKFANARQSITRFVNLPAAPAEFVLFMDDVMVTEPIDRIPICHLGPARNYSAYKTGTGTYARAVRQTTDWLHTHGHPDPLGYLGHTPVPLDTAKVRDFLDDYPADQLLEPFLLYVAAGTAGPGRRTGNAKCAKADNFKHKLSLDIPFISSNPDSWGSELGEWVRSEFTTPSRWER
jgi:hypothetical protein